jgi:hypothetical protein
MQPEANRRTAQIETLLSGFSVLLDPNAFSSQSFDFLKPVAFPGLPRMLATG